MKSPPSQWSSDLDQDFIDNVLVRQAGRPGALLASCNRSRTSSAQVSAAGNPGVHRGEDRTFRLSRIYSVATFYALFNLEPQGRNTICICRGTACHTRGRATCSRSLLLNFGFPTASEDGRTSLSVTTADGSTTLRTVACFGQCALAPVVEVDHASSAT